MNLREKINEVFKTAPIDVLSDKPDFDFVIEKIISILPEFFPEKEKLLEFSYTCPTCMTAYQAGKNIGKNECLDQIYTNFGLGKGQGEEDK